MCLHEMDHVKTFTDCWKAFLLFQNEGRLKTEFTVISLLRWDSKLAYSVNESTNEKWENWENWEMRKLLKSGLENSRKLAESLTLSSRIYSK